ncbi:dual specificity calcium/calmodulin-dependent 3',5'-cyclic nucleotide phosphodiesterase 1B-like isoform X2 [Physella acuta]|uniref:dual specificity calcium/calmodulin-dependent 3',5'-cyclic nucleotide phosphodiesterase 1B-like isoform X2 n=1 Tax=Physella acuta TaxID=109671 RepID=UPI0027DDA563|nr:dual specificity calcium/calmodulin-dependent 3',5'-cyclic nucleotide phosphodiesterase 1B-like isoform X2 [Physella acuta]
MLKEHEDEYTDSAFEWSFLELTDRMKQHLADDDHNLVHKPNLDKPVQFHRVSETGIPRRQSGEIEDADSGFKVELPLQKPPDQLEFKQTIDGWNFDIFALNNVTNGHAMQAIAYEIFTGHGLLAEFHLLESQFMRFIIQVEKHYRRNPYHNASHAADVLQTANCIIKKTGFITLLNKLELMCMLVTAIVHDIEHTGTNNNFHNNSNSELSKLYVVSILENHHLRVGLRMLAEFKILNALDKDKFQEFKFMLTTMILSTDMANHFLLITNVKLMLLTSTKCKSRIRIQRIMMFMLHAADISNPAKPWNVHKVWVSLLCEEFFAQGDKEKELKLPVSPNCDRLTANIATLQIGFAQTFGKETFEVLDSMVEKELTNAGLVYNGYKPWQECLEENMQKWNGKWKYIKYEQIQELLVETAAHRMSIVPTKLEHNQKSEVSWQPFAVASVAEQEKN